MHRRRQGLESRELILVPYPTVARAATSPSLRMAQLAARQSGHDRSTWARTRRIRTQRVCAALDLE